MHATVLLVGPGQPARSLAVVVTTEMTVVNVALVLLAVRVTIKQDSVNVLLDSTAPNANTHVLMDGGVKTAQIFVIVIKKIRTWFVTLLMDHATVNQVGKAQTA